MPFHKRSCTSAEAAALFCAGSRDGSRVQPEVTFWVSQAVGPFSPVYCASKAISREEVMIMLRLLYEISHFTFSSSLKGL